MGTVMNYLDEPNSPGYWAFDGQEAWWNVIESNKYDADAYQGYNCQDEYFKEVKEFSPIRFVTEVVWAKENMRIVTDERSQLYKDKPSIRFLVMYHIQTGIYTKFHNYRGKWYKLKLPWDNEYA